MAGDITEVNEQQSLNLQLFPVENYQTFMILSKNINYEIKASRCDA